MIDGCTTCVRPFMFWHDKLVSCPHTLWLIELQSLVVILYNCRFIAFYVHLLVVFRVLAKATHRVAAPPPLQVLTAPFITESATLRSASAIIFLRRTQIQEYTHDTHSLGRRLLWVHGMRSFTAEFLPVSYTTGMAIIWPMLSPNWQGQLTAKMADEYGDVQCPPPLHSQSGL